MIRTHSHGTAVYSHHQMFEIAFFRLYNPTKKMYHSESTQASKNVASKGSAIV